mmetsp:Transcript_22897/g.58716  ORF Transcript_22897/g.58716 Transcript_22897/m.58716 type:complete len:240 (+) Transcript_22897:501-1220(+)
MAAGAPLGAGPAGEGDGRPPDGGCAEAIAAGHRSRGGLDGGSAELMGGPSAARKTWWYGGLSPTARKVATTVLGPVAAGLAARETHGWPPLPTPPASRDACKSSKRAWSPPGGASHACTPPTEADSSAQRCPCVGITVWMGCRLLGNLSSASGCWVRRRSNTAISPFCRPANTVCSESRAQAQLHAGAGAGRLATTVPLCTFTTCSGCAPIAATSACVASPLSRRSLMTPVPGCSATPR